MKIAVVGTGYVGLVTGTCLAEIGNNVTCVDIDQTKVEKMKAGEVPIYEPGLEDVFKRNISEKRLEFTMGLEAAVKDAQIIFLALPTPPNEDGSADLSYVLEVADELGGFLNHYTVVVDKSTVPVGTSDKVARAIAKNTKVEFDVVSNPEFLREGFAVSDFMKPDRIVIGTSSEKARTMMEKLYEPLVSPENPIYFMNERAAEMTKYAANAFLAVKISFINEIANLCEVLDINVDEIKLGIGSDPRIGKRFLNAGIGYGGSCFPKDVMALQHTAAENSVNLDILKTVTNTNAVQQRKLIDKVRKYYDGDVAGKKFALWGLSFKPDTDDIREAPALEIIDTLTKDGAKIVAFDPESKHNVKRLLSGNHNLSFAKDSHEALKGADALLIATEWSEFKAADPSEITKLMKRQVIFDGRNIYKPEEMKKAGFHYESIGRPVVRAKWE